MIISRRSFLLLTAGFVAGCAADDDDRYVAGPVIPQIVDVGPASQYAANGVYSHFRDRGFFIVREQDKLFALSAICTHRRCKLVSEADHSFYCKCHGSTFDPSGKVTSGPARRSLPVYAIASNDEGRLLVSVTV
jgi:Rieske Fe-S protein